MITLALLATFLEFLFLEFFGYFLSPELSVYPYFYSHGLLPYRHILDQHPPFLFFGPLSLPYFLVSSPERLLSVWVGILFFTNYLVLKINPKNPLLRLFGVISIWLFFSGRTLWTDTFLLLFILATLSLTPFLKGIFGAFIFLLKPTLIPLSILLAIRQKDKRLIYTLGFLIPIIITAVFILKQDLFLEMKYYLLNFNQSSYLSLGKKGISPKELIIFISLVLLFIKQIKLKDLFLCLLAAAPIFPRFEYFHLIPALTLMTVLADFKFNRRKLNIVIFAIFFVLGVKKVISNRIGNFYYNQDIQNTTEYLKKFPDSTLFVLGAGDLLYPLTNRIPPGGVYLPSLPWYLNDRVSVDKLVSSLRASPSTTIVVRPEATLAGDKIILDSPIYLLIKSVYKEVATIGGNRIYQRL